MAADNNGPSLSELGNETLDAFRVRSDNVDKA
jgi:hypothetical protein